MNRLLLLVTLAILPLTGCASENAHPKNVSYGPPNHMSGFSGTRGFSGNPTGMTGFSGTSGFSGNPTGMSNFSGTTGFSGNATGIRNFSGTTGLSGQATDMGLQKGTQLPAQWGSFHGQ